MIQDKKQCMAAAQTVRHQARWTWRAASVGLLSTLIVACGGGSSDPQQGFGQAQEIPINHRCSGIV